MDVSNSTHLGPQDKVRIEKALGAHNDFIIHFGYLTKVFLTEAQLKELKREIEARTNEPTS